MNPDDKSSCVKKTFSTNFQFDENIVIKHNPKCENIFKKNDKQKKQETAKPLLKEFKSEIDENPFFFS